MPTLLTPGGLPGNASARVIVLRSGQSIAGLAWPAHDVQAVLPYGCDFGSFLDDGGLEAVGMDVRHSSDSLLEILSLGLDTSGRVGSVQIAGGTPGTTATVELLIRCTDGFQEPLFLALPIVDRGAGLVSLGSPMSVGGLAITIGGMPVLIS